MIQEILSLAKRMVANLTLCALISLGLFCCSNAHANLGISQLAISPAGDQFVFRYVASDSEAYLMRYNVRSKVTEKFDQPANEAWCNPVFSPNGDWIAFTAYAVNDSALADPANSWIEVMHPDGRERHVVVAANGRVKSIASLSPDGNFILYAEGNASGAGAGFAGFTMWQADLRTHEKARATEESFFQLSSLGYAGRGQIYFAAIAPRHPDAGGKVQHHTDAAQLDANMNLYVNGFHEESDPYIVFPILQQAVVPGMQEKEIDQAKYDRNKDRFYVVMRDSLLRDEARLHHYVRDIYGVDSQKNVKRLTYLNAAQFSGFDIAARGNYLAFVAQLETNPGRVGHIISRLDLNTGEVENFSVDIPGQPSAPLH